MCRRLPRNELVVAVAILSGFLAAGELAAQDPSKPRPTPITIPTTEPILAPQPIAKPSVSDRVSIDPRALPPDLELALRPSSWRAIPSVFTVKNTGLGDARNASLLRVEVRLLPLDQEGRDALARAHWSWLRGGDPEMVEQAMGGPRQVDEAIDRLFARLCPLPYPDFQAAIDALDSGDSQAVSKSGTRVGGGLTAVGPAYVNTATRAQEHSYVKEIRVRVQVVCAYELRARVDANTEVVESNERNNEVVHVFQREVNY